MRKYIELPLKLFLITFIAGALLGVTYMFTEEPIAEQRAYQATLSRQKAFENAEFELLEKSEWEDLYVAEDGSPEISEVYIAKVDGKKSGYVVNVLSGGYGGDVEIVLGIDLNGEIAGLVIGSHNETAGLGANATKESFRDQFKGKMNPVLSKYEPDSDQAVDALTGATITSAAVIDGVDAATSLVSELLEVSE